MNREEFCECGEVSERLFRPNPANIFKSSGLMYEPNYNPGLGQVITSERHYDQVCKDKGVECIGNEKPETVHNYYDKIRQDKIDKAYDDVDSAAWVGNGDQ